MASPRRCGNHLGVQFSGSGLGVEQRTRRGVRGLDAVEAVGENSSYGDRVHSNRRESLSGVRGRSRDLFARDPHLERPENLRIRELLVESRKLILSQVS